MSITTQAKTVSYGDFVLLWGRKSDPPVALTVTEGAQLTNFWGTFTHESLVGKQFGTKVYSKNNRGYCYVLAPTPELWTKALKFRTQVLYVVDISLIILHLELKPGSIVLEAGTGSGSLSTAISRCIAPTGKLYTFEFNQDRVVAAKEDFKATKIDHLVTVTWRDIYSEGFQMKGKYCRVVTEPEKANAVFLDLPSPWLAIASATEALVPNGKICTFSPCIEQVQRNCTALRKHNFIDITTMECLLRPYDVRDLSFDPLPLHSNDNKKRRRRDDEATMETNKELKTEETSEESPDKVVESVPLLSLPTTTSKIGLKPQSEIRGHTGFLTFARKSIYNT